MRSVTKILVKNQTDAIRNKISDNYFALAPVLLFEKIFGIFRFYLRNGQLQSSTSGGTLYGVFMIIIYLIITCIFVDIPSAIKNEEGYVIVLDYVMSYFMCFVNTTTVLSALFIYKQSNSDIITTFAEIDNELMGNSSIEFSKKARVRNLQYLLVLCSSMALFIVIDIVTEGDLLIQSVIDYIMFLMNILETLVFCILIGMMSCRLEIINGYIARFLKDSRENTSVFTLSGKTVALNELDIIGRPSESNMKIHDLALLYGKIGKIGSLINNVFNFQIFMTMQSAFAYSILAICTFINSYKSGELQYSYTLFIDLCIWCTANVVIVTMMCSFCERLRTIRNNTKVFVNQIIMDYNLPKTMRVQAKAFMELIEAWPLRFAIYDMFYLDITLILKFISVCTTYLIIIIQIFHFHVKKTGATSLPYS